MVRGAQSAGLVTYDFDASGNTGATGLRRRVVNSKRTDLSELLLRQLSKTLCNPSYPWDHETSRIFCGHTRFATSSICNIGGCHPHQWTPPQRQTAWRLNGHGKFVGEMRNVEGFITHNGDLDFFTFNGVAYALSDLQRLLARLLGRAMPSDVDSACVAGLLDLLRTKGLWIASVRYGYLFGGLEGAGSLESRLESLASARQLAALATVFEGEWREFACTRGAALGGDGESSVRELASLEQMCSQFAPRMHAKLVRDGETGEAALPLLHPHDRVHAVRRLAEVATRAFLFGDLLHAGRDLMRGAEGSFGLVLSHSLDAATDLVIAARGQTMSVAVYPQSGLVAFGSEAAATKVAMGADGEDASFRLDLDDVGGETVLLRWGERVAVAPGLNDVMDDGSAAAAAPAVAAAASGARVPIVCAGRACEATEVLRYRPGAGDSLETPMAHGPRPIIAVADAPKRAAWTHVLLLVTEADGACGSASVPVWRRRLRLDGNPAVSRLPEVLSRDPVADDLLAIPHAVGRITRDFDGAEHTPNRISAWTFTSRLRARLRMHREGAHDGSVDLLITGCEVSLWIGEQFASDLALAYPKLRIVTLSANKLLGQLGQTLPVPQPGFMFNGATHDFRGSLVLVLSHSGGTYAPLLCCSLFRGYTSDIFLVTSELDTQAARAVRAATNRDGGGGGGGGRDGFVDLTSQFVFSTHVGFRPAEACTVSVAAMHHLLSHLLIFLMGYLSHFEHGRESEASICGYDFEEVRELATIARVQSAALSGIVGHRRLGDTPASAALRRQGHRWAQHVLEGPLSWVLSVLYIAATVLLATTPLGALAAALTGHPLPSPVAASSGVAAAVVNATDPAMIPGWVWGLRYAVAILDVAVYSFLGWWTVVLIRLVQRRPWLHRVAGRSVLIGDVPWVAQSAEAFASKLFALSYSASACAFASANPADHLVHRHTHRVVRGSLLAVGRPDGRVSALTSAEAACALAVNQASSIQSLGVTCESVTLSHSTFKLPLSSAHLVLPTVRPPFMCEVLRDLEHEATPASSRAPSRNPTIHGEKRALELLNAAAARLARSRDCSTRDGDLFTTLDQHEFSRGKGHEKFFSHAMLLDRLGRAGIGAGNSLHGGSGGGGGGGGGGGSGDGGGGGGRPSRIASRSASREASLHAGSRLPSANSLGSLVEWFVGAGSSPAGGGVDTAEHGGSAQRPRESAAARGKDGLKFFTGLSASRSRDASAHRGSHFSAEAALPLVVMEEAALEGDASSSITTSDEGAIPPPAEGCGATANSGAPASPTHERAGLTLYGSPPPSPPPGPPATHVPPSKASDDERAAAAVPYGRRLSARASANDAPSAVRASLSRLGQRNRRLFERAAAGSRSINSESLSAFKRAAFEIEPLAQPFLGAWMTRRAKYSGLGTEGLLKRQALVQVLSETRFDALQRLCAFFVLFHAMGKDVADWWRAASCGLLGYDMSRTQSIMRVATTASPVSGMEVRERMLAIQAETRRAGAASSVQRIWRAVWLSRWVAANVRRRRSRGALAGETTRVGSSESLSDVL